MSGPAVTSIKGLSHHELAELDTADARNELGIRVTEAMDHYRHLSITELHALLYAKQLCPGPALVHHRAIRDLIIIKASSPGGPS